MPRVPLSLSHPRDAIGMTHAALARTRKVRATSDSASKALCRR